MEAVDDGTEKGNSQVGSGPCVDKMAEVCLCAAGLNEGDGA